MNQKTWTHGKVRRLVTLALLTAIVVVLQLFGSFLTIGSTPISLTLVPIVIGAILLGPGAGAILGAAFGVVTFCVGLSGRDWFTAMLISVSPFWSVSINLTKGICAGAGAGWIAKAFRKRRTVGCILASLAAPILNTGVFVLHMVTVLRPGLENFAGSVGEANAMHALFFVLIGVNFLIEMAVNAVLSAGIARVAEAVRKTVE